jgi:hypothetical protein
MDLPRCHHFRYKIFLQGKTQHHPAPTRSNHWRSR